MSKPLTERTRKQIIEKYTEVGNYSEVARIFGVAPNSVKNVVKGDPKFAEKCEKKKMQNEKDIIAFMEGKKNKVCKMIDLYLDALIEPEKIERATPNQLSTALGTVLDKFLMAMEKKEEKEDGGGVIFMPEVDKRE